MRILLISAIVAVGGFAGTLHAQQEEADGANAVIPWAYNPQCPVGIWKRRGARPR